jgi:hypothetical protein
MKVRTAYKPMPTPGGRDRKMAHPVAEGSVNAAWHWTVSIALLRLRGTGPRYLAEIADPAVLFDHW